MPHLSCLLLLLLFPLRLNSIAQTDHAESKWESDIQAFEASDRIKILSPGGLLFVGSSTIRLWHSLEDDLPRVIRRGFGGSHLADTLRFADRIVLPYRLRQIVLYAGDNDIKDGKSPNQVFKDFQAFVARVHAVLPETRITFLAINSHTRDVTTKRHPPTPRPQTRQRPDIPSTCHPHQPGSAT
jgi:hypothetical protein